MKKYISHVCLFLLTATICPVLVCSEDIVSVCENAAYATGYVYEDQYVVSVDTNIIDKFESEVMWVEIHKKQL